MTAGLQGWTPFQACDRMRLLGSLQTHVNVGPCTFCVVNSTAAISRWCQSTARKRRSRRRLAVLPQSRSIPVDIALEGVGEGSHMTKERLTPDTSMSNCCSPDQTHVLCRLSQLSRRLHSA